MNLQVASAGTQAEALPIVYYSPHCRSLFLCNHIYTQDPISGDQVRELQWRPHFNLTPYIQYG